MANKKEMFESGLAKMDFFLKGDDVFNEAAEKLAKKEAAEKKVENVSNIVANQKAGSSK